MRTELFQGCARARPPRRRLKGAHGTHPVHEPSAKADIAFSEPRIHSPGDSTQVPATSDRSCIHGMAYPDDGAPTHLHTVRKLRMYQSIIAWPKGSVMAAPSARKMPNGT